MSGTGVSSQRGLILLSLKKRRFTPQSKSDRSCYRQRKERKKPESGALQQNQGINKNAGSIESQQDQEREKNAGFIRSKQNHKLSQELPEQKKADSAKPAVLYPGERLKF